MVHLLPAKYVKKIIAHATAVVVIAKNVIVAIVVRISIAVADQPEEGLQIL